MYEKPRSFREREKRILERERLRIKEKECKERPIYLPKRRGKVVGL